MKLNAIQKSTALVMIASLAGCMPGFLSRPVTGSGDLPTVSKAGGVQVVTEGDTTTVQHLGRVLEGSVSLGGDRRVAATVGDVVNNATVAIIDPSTNTTIATSVTDGAGRFAIPLPERWSPGVGSDFVIEAFKGLGNNAAGQNLIRMRSLIRKLNLTDFTSATGTDSIGINPGTTAVYLKSTAGFGTMPVATAYFGDAKGTIKTDGTRRQSNQFGAVTDAEIDSLRDMVAESIAGNADPLAAVNPTFIPTVTSFSAYNGAPGTLISINGTGYSPLTTGNTVLFAGNATASVMFASKSQLVVVVPAGALTGNVKISTKTGDSPNTGFTVNAPLGTDGSPVIANLDNRVIQAGATLRLGGSNFVAGGNTVTFSAGAGTTPQAAAYVSDNMVSVTVPAAAKSGPITVTNAKGTSNGYWLEVLHQSGSIVEDFATTAKRDGGVTNIQWQGGASPTGVGTVLQNTITAFDSNTLAGVQNVYDGADPNYPATMQLAIQQAETAYPVPTNTSVPTDVWTNNVTSPLTYLLATNGYQIFRGNNAGTPVMSLHSAGFDGMPFGRQTPNYALNIPGYAPTKDYKLAGMVGSSNYFTLVENFGGPTLLGLPYLNVSNPAAPTLSADVPFRAADGVTQLGLTKVAAWTYGYKLASDGTYIYILAGPGQEAGVPVYTQPVNLYKLRPDNPANPTTLTLVQVITTAGGIAVPTTNQLTGVSSYIVGLMVDRRGFYLPGYNAGGGVHSYSVYSFKTAAQRVANYYVNFRNADGYYPIIAYDSVHDDYYSTSYVTGNNWYRHAMPSRIYEATGSIVTPTQVLPANTKWSQVSMVMDTLPAGTAVTYDVLDSGGAAVAGFQGLTPGASLASLGNTQIKIRVNLSTPNPYTTTPVIRALNVYTVPDTPVAQSTAYLIPGADANDRIVIDSVQYIHTTNKGTLTYRFADSADDTGYVFQDTFTGVFRRYLKWQIVPTISTDKAAAMAPPITRRIQINYHY